jgi:hypothetical protein
LQIYLLFFSNIAPILKCFKIKIAFWRTQVIVVCLATMTMSAPTDTRPTTVTAEEPEGRLQEESQGKDVWGFITYVYSVKQLFFFLKILSLFFTLKITNC